MQFAMKCIPKFSVPDVFDVSPDFYMWKSRVVCSHIMIMVLLSFMYYILLYIIYNVCLMLQIKRICIGSLSRLP